MTIAVEKRSLQANIYSRLERHPEGRSIMFYGGGEAASWITFEEFYNRSAAYAAALAERNLAKSDVCILVLPSEQQTAELLMATLLLGAIPLLIAPPTMQASGAFSSLTQVVNGIVGKTKPRIVILSASLSKLQHNISSQGGTSSTVILDSEISVTRSIEIPIVIPEEDDLAAMQLTSGTTGFPRICVWRQKSVVAALDGMAKAMAIEEDDVCLNWTPLYHDMGLVNNFFLCMAAGMPLVMLKPTDFVKSPDLWLRSLHQTGATTTWSPNFGFALAAQRVRDRDLDGIRLDNVRAYWNAAERIHYGTMKAFYERFEPYGVRWESLKTNFGCAENIGGATFSDPKGGFKVDRLNQEVLHHGEIAQRVEESDLATGFVEVVGVGRPYPGMKIKILSDDGSHLPDGRVGEIALDTPSRMEGYLGDETATRISVEGSLVRTGDLGYMRNGELYWVGRVRERINIRGVKLDPSDFEPMLLDVEGLRHGNFAAFGVDDIKQGTQKIVLICEVRDSTTRSAEEISNEIRDRIFRHLGINIGEILLVRKGTLTKTSSGKRRHRYFKQLYIDDKLKDFEWTREASLARQST